MACSASISSSPPVFGSRRSSGAVSMHASSTALGRLSGRSIDQSRGRLDQKWSDRIDLDGIGNFLRAVYPEKTAVNVAADTGLAADSIKKWLNGEAAPGFKATFILIGAYGPEFAMAMFRGAPEWLSRAAAQHRIDRLEEAIEVHKQLLELERGQI